MKKIIISLIMTTIILLSTTGCNEKKQDNSSTVSWYMFGVKSDSSYDMVFEKVNEKLQEKYGLKLDMVLIDEGNFDTKMQMLNAGRESYDLVFTSNWLNDYYNNISNGSFYDITKLLPKEAPTLYKSLNPEVLEALKNDGSIYAVPNWQVQARACGIKFTLKTLEMSETTVDMINNLDDVTTYLEKVMAKNPEYNKFYLTWQPLMTYYNMITISPEKYPGVYYYNKSGKPIVVNQYETPEFRSFVTLMNDWVKRGLMASVVSKSSGAQLSNNANLKSPLFITNYKPGFGKLDMTSESPSIGRQFSTAVTSTETLLSTLTAIGANSKHPEESMRILEIMNTDKEIYNLLAHGIEGVNYTKVGDKKIKTIEGNNYALADWALGSIKNTYLREKDDDDLIEKTEKFNNEAIKSEILGFQLNSDPISVQMTNCKNIIDKQLDTLSSGNAVPQKDVDQFISDLKTAGSDAIIAEIQKQVDEWWKKNK